MPYNVAGISHFNGGDRIVAFTAPSLLFAAVETSRDVCDAPSNTRFLRQVYVEIREIGCFSAKCERFG